MIELVRVVEHQASLSSYRATQDEDRAVQLELLIEITKPKQIYSQWHTLIATPFRYSPPHPQGRFRSVYGKNVFYASLVEETALYEHAFHFMKQRRHLKIKSATGVRTIFIVNAKDNDIVHIKNDENFSAIMDKNNYLSSHQFIEANPNKTFIIYPSCRDPQQRDNAAILSIAHLEKTPKKESSIKFFYDNTKKEISWLDYKLHIKWDEVV